MKVRVISIVPSPYQRDMFRALAAQPGLSLQVSYLEEAAPDSPWPAEALSPFESILPGVTVGKGRVRCHTNWRLPQLSDSDVVVVNAAVTGLTTQLVMRQCIHQQIPFIFWGEILRPRTGLRGFAQRSLASPMAAAAAIVAIGSKAETDYRVRYPDTQVFELPYYCDISEFQEATNNRKSKGPVKFLFCGQMIERKGFDLLLDAFSHMVKSGIDARLSLAGRETTFSNDLIGRLQDEVRERLRVVGFVSPRDLPQLFSESDVFVLPSRHDGWGVVVNQAIGAGLPIISTDSVGAALDLVHNGRNGFVVQPGDEPELRAAMVSLATDRALRRSMAVEAESIAEQLHPQVGASRFSEILQDAMATESRAQQQRLLAI